MFIGVGTVANVATVVIGGSAGMVVGHLLGEHTRRIITDALGLVTLLFRSQATIAVFDPVLADYVGSSAPMLILLGALVIGGILGSWWRIEHRLESFGGWLQARLSNRERTDGGKERFIEGYITASLVFCVGPLTVLGSLQDGLGQGADQLFLKSALDGFAALAFAASFGLGVVASAVSVALIQGALTAVGVVLGSYLPEPYLLAITATGGLILVGVALRLMDIRRIAVGDLLPGLAVAPLLMGVVIMGQSVLA